MTSIDFDDAYVNKIIDCFASSDDQNVSFLDQRAHEQGEFEFAFNLDADISEEDHHAFVETMEKLSETISSCTLAIFEARQNGNRIATVGLVKMLSKLFWVGHQASEDRLKFKWTDDGRTEMEEKIQAYKNLSDAILIQPEQFEEDQKLAVPKTLTTNAIINQENSPIVELSDEENVIPVRSSQFKPLIRSRTPLNTTTEDEINDDTAEVYPIFSRLGNRTNSQNTSPLNDNSVVPVRSSRSRPSICSTTPLNITTEDDADEVFPIFSRLGNISVLPDRSSLKSRLNDKESEVVPAKRSRNQSVSTLSSTDDDDDEMKDETTEIYPVISRMGNRPPPTSSNLTCIVYKNIKVGYSDFGKLPIIIAVDPNDDQKAYCYRSMQPSSVGKPFGNFRCSFCNNYKVNRYAKLYRGVLYANIHECKGASKYSVEQEQKLRANKYRNAELPTLKELSALQDPRPYPALPKPQNRQKRKRDPSTWSDLVEYQRFEKCLMKRLGTMGMVAYDSENPEICYVYSPVSKSSYKCLSCFSKEIKTTTGKVNKEKNVFASTSHCCHGVDVADFEATQAFRREALEAAASSARMDA